MAPASKLCGATKLSWIDFRSAWMCFTKIGSTVVSTPVLTIKKSAEIRQQQDRLRRRLAEVSIGPQLPPLIETVDLIALTAKSRRSIPRSARVREQRKLLRLVLEDATWKGGELRMSFREAVFAIATLEPCNSHKKRELNC